MCVVWLARFIRPELEPSWSGIAQNYRDGLPSCARYVVRLCNGIAILAITSANKKYHLKSDIERLSATCAR
jgi:hypothetical protein